jgi:tetratricopeptide (TPR) repeat protein
MGFRFSKSIRLGKHVRLNISKSGIGMSAGVKGARISTGSRGTRLTTSIPGTGLSHTSTLGAGCTAASSSRSPSTPTPLSQQRAVNVPKPPSPGMLAPAHEKAFYKAINAFQEGKRDEALTHFLEAAQKDAGAGILAGLLLAQHPDRIDNGIAYLEAVVASDIEFPTPLMQKYIANATMKLDITAEVQVLVPIDGLGAALLLAELYQQQDRLQEAIGLLEELDDLVDEPALTLSLCDLYASVGVWDGIIARAEKANITDNITLETTVLRGRAMQAKGLDEAAIAVFTEALKKKKDRDPDLLNEAAYWRAVSYESIGKKSQASKDFQKLYAEAPNFRDVAQRISA